MARLATPKLIKSRQEASITATLPSNGVTATFTATIAPVKTDRALVNLMTITDPYDGTASARFSYDMGVELQDATTLKLTVTTTSLGGGPWVIPFKAQVIELFSKPKSLQTVSGNGTTSQTISQVDPARAVIVRGHSRASNGGSDFNPTLGATAVTWNAAVPTAFRYQVIQFN